MRKDLIITFITQFIVLCTGILLYKYAANYLGNEGFSEYALCRRSLSFIQSLVLLGLSVGIPRYIAISSSDNLDSSESDAYYISGITILSLITLIVIIALFNFKNTFSYIIFGNRLYYRLIYSLGFMLIGMVIHFYCYSYFRGHQMMAKANILQIINSGLIPVSSFYLGKNVTEVLNITGFGWIIVSTTVLIIILLNLSWKKINIISHSRDLIVYGIQRIPGDLGLSALFTLPSTITAHIAGVNEAGYVAFATALLNMTGKIFTPIGLVLLPHASKIVANKDFNKLNIYINKLLAVTFGVSLFGVITYEIFAATIIIKYLGEIYPDIVIISRIIMLSGVAFAIYVSLRSIIDALYVRAINTKNILLSLSIFMLFSLLIIIFSLGYKYIAILFMCSILILGALTINQIFKIMMLSSKNI